MYNCESQIPRVLARFDESACNIFDEILIVDNGSNDSSLKSAKLAAEKLENIKITIVQNVENYNLGGSHKVAFNYALENNYDYLVVIHGDDQGDINDVVPLLKLGEHRDWDCLLGSRFLKHSKLTGYSQLRIFGNWGINLLGSIICRRILYDMGAGLNIYNMKMLEDQFYLRFSNGLTFNYYMMFYTVGIKASFKYFSSTWREEDQISNLNMISHLKEWLIVIKNYLFNFNYFMNEYHCPDQKYEYNTLYTIENG
jgi:glycosyltransferase involved in cell wall biosynthesis